MKDEIRESIEKARSTASGWIEILRRATGGRREEFEKQRDRAQSRAMEKAVGDALNALNRAELFTAMVQRTLDETLTMYEANATSYLERSSEFRKELSAESSDISQANEEFQERLDAGAYASTSQRIVHSLWISTLLWEVLLILIDEHDSVYEKRALKELKGAVGDIAGTPLLLSFLGRLRSVVLARMKIIDAGDESAAPFEFFSDIVGDWPNLCDEVISKTQTSREAVGSVEEWIRRHLDLNDAPV